MAEQLKFKTFVRHHTKSLTFDENGNATRGEQEKFDKKFEDISMFAEKLPSSLTQEAYSSIMTLFNKIVDVGDSGVLSVKSPIKFFKDEMEGFVDK